MVLGSEWKETGEGPQESLRAALGGTGLSWWQQSAQGRGRGTLGPLQS